MMLRTAIAYATRRPGGVDWPVFGVSRSKAPLCARGVYDGTTDADALGRMFSREPDANLAVRCEGFGVLDIDPRNGGHLTINEWGARHGDFPRTWESKTGSGGTHLYFLPAPQLAELPLGKIAPGVDYKGNGKHYVLVPPSVTRGPYSWLVKPTECPLAEPPAWLIRHIVATKQRPPRAEAVDLSSYRGVDRVERARRYARHVDPAVSGQSGHDHTYRVACTVARGFALSEPEAISVLSEWNARCEPPWSSGDLRRKIQQALACGTDSTGYLLERRRAG